MIEVTTKEEDDLSQSVLEIFAMCLMITLSLFLLIFLGFLAVQYSQFLRSLTRR